MVHEGIDVPKFRKGLQLVLEWGFNPFKTAANMGASGAGAVLGSALGPVGTALGGVAGGLAGKAGSALAGKFMGKATTAAILPAYEKAQQAIADLNAALGNVAAPEAAPLKQDMANLKQSLDNAKTTVATVNQKENERLDNYLKLGGGWAGQLKSATGTGKMGELSRWLGGALERIPVMKQDAGLRRAMAKGMDSLQAWAASNPKKAAMLNAAAGLGGAALGGMAGGALGGGPNAPQQQDQNTPQQPTQTAQNAIPSKSGPTEIQGFQSGIVDNGAELNWQNQSFTASPDGKSMTQTKSGVFGPGDVRPDTTDRAGQFFKRLIRNRAGKVVGSESGGSGRLTGFIPD